MKLWLLILRFLCWQAEWLDAREALFAAPEALEADWAAVMERRERLVGAPALADLCRFPSLSQAGDACLWNAGFRRVLSERMAFDHINRDALAVVHGEAERLYLAWDALRDARQTCFYVPVRRAALARLRGLLGLEAFGSGRMPDAVPVWRFERR